ncbi:MAG: hypothetical protein WB711_04550 [Terriglobales bacterium]
MHRLTARSLLVLMLVGVFVPVALAISPPPATVCCLRTGMHHCGMADDGPAFRAPCPCDHPSWLPLSVSQLAHLRPAATALGLYLSEDLQADAQLLQLSCATDHAHSGRAPPQSSVA